MYICNVQKYSCNLCSEVTKVKEKRCNCISPAQAAIVPEMPNHHPDPNQQAKENKYIGYMGNRLTGGTLATMSKYLDCTC